jgi:hypothetical protein
MPVFLVACCLLVGRWRRITVTHWVVLSFGIAVTAFYYAEQFLLASNILEFFYYFSYLMPAVFLMLAYLWQMLWEETGRRTPAFITLGLTALLAQWALSIWGGWALPDLTFSRWLALAAMTALVVFLATRERRLPFVQDKLPWLALVFLSGFFSAGLANYGRITGNGPPLKNVETDVYRVAVQFTRAIPKRVDHPGEILFWYNNRASSLGSIQSTYLWGYSKLNANLPEDPGLPHLGELQLQLLGNTQVRYLGLLAESEEEVSQGLAALTREAVGFKSLDHRVLASGNYRVYFQLVELKHEPSAVTR